MSIIYENEDILSEVKADMSVIPANTLSFSENALYVAEAVERDFNEMFESIGVNELAVFESTGVQIVYEGDEQKSLKEKIIGFFKKLWEKIKAAFEAALVKFEALKMQAKKQIPTIKESDIEGFDDDKKFGKSHEFGELMHRSYGRNAADYAKFVSDEFAKLAKKEGLEATEVADKAKELEEDICAKVSGFDGVKSVKEMQDAMVEKLMGDEVEVDKAFIKKHLDEINGIVIQGSSVKHIKELYKTSRKYIDECIKTAKSYTDERAKVMSSEVKVLKSIGQCMNSANGKALDISKRRYTEYRNILVRIAIALGKVKKEEVKANNESTVMERHLELIESALDF